MQEMFDLGDGLAVNSNPGGRFHGWLFRRHPDGQYVSVRKLSAVANPYGSLTTVFDTYEWKCGGCSIVTPRRMRSCECPTNVVYRQDGKRRIQAWKVDNTDSTEAESTDAAR